MKRILKFENFRNIGIYNKSKLLLNTSLDKEKCGELIILIGPNNSGKSNILDAITIFMNDSQIKDRDITNLIYDDEYKNPKLSIEYYDSQGIVASLSKNKENLSLTEYSNKELNEKSIKNEIENMLKNKENLINNNPYIFNNLKALFEIFEEINTNSIDKVIEKISNYVLNLPNQIMYYSNNNIKKSVQEFINKNSSILYTEIYKDDINVLNKKLKDEYDINFLPNIFKYEDNVIKQEHLKIDFNQFNIENSLIFKNLFNRINYNIETLKNAYENYQKQNVFGFIKQQQKNINKELQKISDDFNKLYTFNNEVYSFEIDLSDSFISLSIYVNSEPVNLDYQSTGFKWFFNFYFNLLSSNKLTSGDIIVIDEPGVHLSVNGIKELRKFLKDFAIKNNITIVVSTHSPFMIDLDYLDEIRVININDKNEVNINNHFHSIENSDSDTIFNIKKSLTVENNILFNENNIVVFVEGITDYNYLVAFKYLLFSNNNQPKLIFLPFNGVGKSKEEMLEISERILKIKRTNSIVLVDGDKNGNEFKKINNPEKSSLNIYSLSDINSKFTDIESLFTEEDKRKLNILSTESINVKNEINKSFVVSSNFKNYIDKYKLSKETKQNFKELFEFLEKNI